MLNVNAKAFVPPGVVDGAHQSFHSNAWYRYRINVAVQDRMSKTHEERYLNNISSLLTAKYLYADRGSIDEDALQYFVNEEFMDSNNIFGKEEGQKSSGFLLSRSILAHFANVNAINSANDSKGILLHLDLPSESNGDVALLLCHAWDTFFGTVSHDPQIIAVGYSRSFVGNKNLPTTGMYRHYFFLASSPDSIEPLSNIILSDCPTPLLRVVPVSSIVPYICSPCMQFGVALTVGDEAKQHFLKGKEADYSLVLSYAADRFDSIWEELERYDREFRCLLMENEKWDRIRVLHLHVNADTISGQPHIPIWDIIRFVGQLCDDCNSAVVGVSFSSASCGSDERELLSRNKDAPFFVKATLDEMLQRSCTLDVGNTCFGGFPSHVESTPGTYAFMAAIEGLNLWRRRENMHPPSYTLSQMTFADAADSFARNSYLVRRRSVGTRTLVGTDSKGNVFGIDVNSNSIFGLPICFGGAIDPVVNCIFSAVLSSSYRSSVDYRLIIEDIMIFEGRDVGGAPFVERLHMIESLGIEDESSWPHAHPSHLIILRADYVPLKATKELIDFPVLDHNNLGLVFTPSAQIEKQDSLPTFSWVPPSAITACFSVERVENSVDGIEGLKRAFLGVRPSSEENKATTAYDDEYADYQKDAYPSIVKNSIIECILHRAEDGAHWWDILQDYDEGEGRLPATFNEVDLLVHSPGVTQAEMLWLLNAPSYQCDRCHKVNDVGRNNVRHNAYWCKNCWIETGHGDCTYCGRAFSLGMLDGKSQLFYCESCWNAFGSSNTEAQIGYHVPPPPEATFTQQVMTRCVSLLIDLMNPKAPSNDVLDLCCGGSVLRKWMRNKTNRYLGIDVKRSVVDSMLGTISTASDMPPDAHYEIVCADAFSDDFWISTITKIHPRQFHVITCFAGLHHAFAGEEKARHFLGSVANALVPGGVFLGTFIDSSVLFAKGRKYSSGIVKVGWSENSVPRIGHTFSFTAGSGPVRDVSVIPIDFLIAVASEYGLNAVSEAYLTFRELIEKDPSWTKVPSSDEKEYLCALRTFAFKKESSEQMPSVAA